MTPRGERLRAITGLGIGQILAWGSSFYLLAVLAEPITQNTGWPGALVVGGLSVALIASGLISPPVGSLISRGHGRLVLAASPILFSAGLATMAVSATVWVYLTAWIAMGVGMGAGLYSGAFAALGQLYGRSARSAITALTLFGGLASTVCWPLSTFLVAELGWRWTCAVYAGIHLLVVLPLYLATIPRGAARAEPDATPISTSSPVAASRGIAILVGAIITLGGVVATVMSVHLFALLGSLAIPLAAAVALGALIGPSQVGARLIELTIGRHHHPMWTMVVSSAAIATGVTLLALGAPVVALVMVVYGAGLGLSSIASGTVPLALVGQAGYAKLMGRIALPSLLAQAGAPIVGSLLLESIGEHGTLVVLASIAAASVVLVVIAMIVTTPHRRAYSALTAPG